MSGQEKEVVRRRGRGRHREIPADILENAALRATVEASLPGNYRFEVEKTLWRLREVGAKKVALQLPEGLLMYGNALAEIFSRFHNGPLKVAILGDTTYGACCVDDLTAKALGADLLVHYGHSCLVPSNVTGPLKTLYVFVDISFDPSHLVESCVQELGPTANIALLGTVQFLRTIHKAAAELKRRDGWSVAVPQASPLSSGEVLGCTSPALEAKGEHLDAMVFVADGRFHLEAAMIKNPTLAAYRYDPYAKRLTRERYDRGLMADRRRDAVLRAKGANAVAIVLGTLGRQGSPAILRRLKAVLRDANIKNLVVLASELDDRAIADLAHQVQAIVQICCPRLSIDWGHTLPLPLLSPYEAFAAFDPAYASNFAPHTDYPMDFYASNSGPWTNYFSPQGGRVVE